MLKVYAAEEVHAALPWQALVDALAQAFAEGASVPLRHAHQLGGADTLLLMPAWSANALGVKVVTVMPENAARGVASVQATYLLLERDSGEAIALLDGEALTLRRTAAASALAARYLARDDARTLLLVGSGRLAGWMARAHVSLRPAIDRVLVWGRNAGSREALAGTLRGEGLPAQAVSDLEAAVRGADIVTCATTAKEPVVRGAWLSPGTHLDLVGGFRRDMREVDDQAVLSAALFVDTYQGALEEAGDLTQPLAAGLIVREQVQGDLASLVGGSVKGRRNPTQVTLFKSVGTALEDLAAAQLVAGAHR
ncbi:MAG: ornithine cyclodeaminase family protein [Burkholderiaceae bacterium]|nr:ornithine cyclodeaminase family protein [Burkholderiaceae bacterium]